MRGVLHVGLTIENPWYTGLMMALWRLYVCRSTAVVGDRAMGREKKPAHLISAPREIERLMRIVLAALRDRLRGLLIYLSPSFSRCINPFQPLCTSWGFTHKTARSPPGLMAPAECESYDTVRGLVTCPMQRNSDCNREWLRLIHRLDVYR